MKTQIKKSIIVSKETSRLRRLVSFSTHGFLFIIASVSTIAVAFIIFFIAKEALPFFNLRGFKEFFTSIQWYPSASQPEFGALSIIYGSIIVTLLAALIAVPFAVLSAICLSDILSFSVRQIVKPVIEVIAAIPSVAFGFFALVVFAPILQRSGGHLLGVGVWLLGLPLNSIIAYLVSDILADKIFKKTTVALRTLIFILLECIIIFSLYKVYTIFDSITINSGTNILNVSVILAIMILPTIVSVSEDALQAVGKELRQGSYALGATRTETILKVVVPSAKSGIITGIILGIMRAVGETMVVWMASGNAAQIPQPWYNIFEPVRTLTATIAGDMGEADHVTGSARYHVLFAMALLLLLISFISNLISEWFVARSKKKMGI